MTGNEKKFLWTWTAIAGPPLAQEYHFNRPARHRFDFAHLESLTAVEVEGGAWILGRHNRGKGFAADCRKYFDAGLAGWMVFRLTPEMITVENCKRLAAFMAGRQPKP